jgi:hypothetical protein
VTPGGRWNKFKTYSTIQRTFEIWSFVATFVVRFLLIKQKWSYRGGMTELKQVNCQRARRRLDQFSGNSVAGETLELCIILSIDRPKCPSASIWIILFRTQAWRSRCDRVTRRSSLQRHSAPAESPIFVLRGPKPQIFRPASAILLCKRGK